MRGEPVCEDLGKQGCRQREQGEWQRRVLAEQEEGRLVGGGGRGLGSPRGWVRGLDLALSATGSHWRVGEPACLARSSSTSSRTCLPGVWQTDSGGGAAAGRPAGAAQGELQSRRASASRAARELQRSNPLGGCSLACLQLSKWGTGWRSAPPSSQPGMTVQCTTYPTVYGRPGRDDTNG